MLGKLFGSKARVKILKLFLSSPDEKFYIRQVARELKLQLNSVRRELDNLEQFGLLTANPGDNDEEVFVPSRESFIRDIKSAPKK
jgi:predicted ArsR family transcriptional regulator